MPERPAPCSDPAPAPADAATTPPLAAYFRETFRPVIERRLTYGRVNIFTRAVELLDRFAGGRLKLGQVDESLLSRFIEADNLVKAGCSAKHRRELAGCIRQVVRHWNPAALAPARARGDEGAPVLPRSLREYCQQVYLPRVAFGATPSHAEHFRGVLNVLAEHYGRELLLSELTDALAAEHFRWLLANGRKAATVNRHRRYLFCLWRHAADAGLVERHPRVKRLPEPREAPDAWSVEQFERILAAALRFQPGRSVAGVPLNLWWHGVLLLGWYTALRRRAILALRRSNVDLHTGWIYAEAAASKTKRGKRFRLGPDAIAALKRIWKPERELLFPPIEGSTQMRHFQLILADAGIPASGNYLSKFHKLRRTSATHLAARAGVAAASQLLQHASESLTRACYLDDRFLPEIDVDVTAHMPPLAYRQRSAHN